MSKTFELTGCISKIKPIQTFPSGFQKQEVVVNDKDPKYPQEIAIQFTRDMVNKLADYHEGDHVCIKFAIRGHEFNEKHYNDLNAIRIERAKKLGGESYVGQPAPAQYNESAPTTPGAPTPPQQQYDELPF